MKKLLIFDFDGVIVDSFEVLSQMVENILKLSPEEYRNSFMGNVFSGIGKEPLARFEEYGADKFFGQYEEKIIQQGLDPSVKETIETLSNKYEMAINSSTPSGNIIGILEAFGLRDLFTYVYGSDISRSKVEKFEMLFKEADVSKADSVFITDTVGDVRDADEFGIDSIAVTFGFHDQYTFEREGVKPALFVGTFGALTDTINAFRQELRTS